MSPGLPHGLVIGFTIAMPFGPISLICVQRALGQHADGWILPVRAQPGARKAGVQGEQGGRLKVAVTAPPEDGKANRALLEVLRDVLGLKRSQVELLSGETSVPARSPTGRRSTTARRVRPS